MRNLLLLVGVMLLASCSNVLDNPLNAEHLTKVKEKIESNDSYSPMKKKYLVKNISDQTGYVAMAEAMKIDRKNIPTFKEKIEELSTDFDSIRSAKLALRESNKKIEKFISLKDAKTTAISEYKGFLSMTLNFNNEFDKEILYIILGYGYVNKYDSKFFDEKSKLTDEVAGDFKGELEIVTTEEYNDVAEFMYKEVPIQASLKDREELGVEEANRKVEKEFLMEGLQVSTLGIVFKDKTEIFLGDADWEYLEEEMVAAK